MNREPSFSEDWNGEYDPARYDPDIDNRKCLDCHEELTVQSTVIYCEDCWKIVAMGM